MHIRSLPLLIAALPLLGCGDLFVATVEEPDLCITLEGEEFPAADGEERQLKMLSYDLGPALPKQAGASQVELEVRLVSFRVTAGEDLEDLDFISSASLEFLDGSDPDAPGQPVATFVPGDEPAGRTIEFEVESRTDFGAAVQARKVLLGAQLEGLLPEEPWTADTRACFHVVSRIHYF